MREQVNQWLQELYDSKKNAPPMGQIATPRYFATESGRILADWTKGTKAEKRVTGDEEEPAYCKPSLAPAEEPAGQSQEIVQYTGQVSGYANPPPSEASKPAITLSESGHDSQEEGSDDEDYDTWVNKGAPRLQPDIAGQRMYEDTGIEPWYGQ